MLKQMQIVRNIIINVLYQPCSFISTCGWLYITTLMWLLPIREYGSTLYVGMARKKHGRLYISIANDDMKSLVIYTDRF